MVSGSCHDCGKSYKSLTAHWTQSSCEFQPFSPRQEDILNGILLNNGSITSPNSTPRFLLSTRNESFARWLANELDPFVAKLTTDTRPCKYDEEAGEVTQYIVRTCTHEDLHNYQSRWYTEDGDRTFPDEYDITPIGLRCAYTVSGWTDDNGIVCLPLPKSVPHGPVRDVFYAYDPTIRVSDRGSLLALKRAEAFFDTIETTDDTPEPTQNPVDTSSEQLGIH